MWTENELDLYAARHAEAEELFDIGCYETAREALCGELDSNLPVQTGLKLLRRRRQMNWRNGDPCVGGQYIIATSRGIVGLAVFNGKGWEWQDHRGRGVNALVEDHVVGYRRMPEFPEHLRHRVKAEPGA